MKKQFTIAFATAACAALLFTGCGRPGGSDRISTVPVTGTVLLDGKPIAGAVVSFVSTESGRHSFMGSTDAEGKYTLTGGPNVGAQAGGYNVVIEYYTMPSGEPIEITPDTDLDMMKKQGEVKQVLAPIYSDPEQTELHGQVEPKRDNVIDFALKSS